MSVFKRLLPSVEELQKEKLPHSADITIALDQKNLQDKIRVAGFIKTCASIGFADKWCALNTKKPTVGDLAFCTDFVEGGLTKIRLIFKMWLRSKLQHSVARRLSRRC